MTIRPTPSSSSFWGSYNLFRSSKAFAGEAAAAMPSNANAVTFVRPHDVNISHENFDGSGIAAAIKHIAFAGSSVNVELTRLDNGEAVDAALPAHDYKDLGLKPKDQVFLRLRNATSFPEDSAPAADESLAAHPPPGVFARG